MEEEYSGTKIRSKQKYEEKINKYKCQYRFILKTD
jgi:hypothetical protein